MCTRVQLLQGQHCYWLPTILILPEIYGVTCKHLRMTTTTATGRRCSFSPNALSLNMWHTIGNQHVPWCKMETFFPWGSENYVQLATLGAIQSPSHCLNQWWLVYWRIYASIGLNGLNSWDTITLDIQKILYKYNCWKLTSGTCWQLAPELAKTGNACFSHLRVFLLIYAIVSTCDIYNS